MLYRLAALSLLALSLLAQRVVLVSFDGLGNHALFHDPAGAELTLLHQSARRGAVADGVQTAFPSTTANSHAALWTGAYGDVNSITANNPPILPRASHTFTERTVGFRATQLSAETFWVTAAKAGIRAVAHQPTQGYPFTPFNSAPGATVVNGYQTRLIAPYALHSITNQTSLHHGPLTLTLARTNRGLRITANNQSVEVHAAPAESDAPRRRPLARRFSKPLYVSAPEAALYFRLFETPGQAPRLLITAWHELGASEPLPGLIRQAGGFLGNGAHALLSAKQISDEEYLETAELATLQLNRHAAWLNRTIKPRLLQTYLPFPDEFDHEWLPASLDGDARARALRTWGYVIVHRASLEFARLAAKRDHLLWVSDHGMAPVRQQISVGRILKDAGLDSKVAYLYNSILVNTTDWKGGIVPPNEKAQVVAATRAALAAHPQFTAFYTPERDGKQFGIGGPAGGDLYFDLAPGLQATGRADLPVLSPLTPRGVHGFFPLRPEILSICILTGPAAKPGTRWPRLRSIDIAPLIAQLLGINPPTTVQGRSPLAIPSVR